MRTDQDPLHIQQQQTIVHIKSQEAATGQGGGIQKWWPDPVQAGQK